MYEDHYSGNVCNLVFILNKGRTVSNKKIRINEEKKKMWFACFLYSDYNLQDISDNLTKEYDKNQIFFVVGYEMGIWLGLQLNLR